jgi:hypothetical protein
MSSVKVALAIDRETLSRVDGLVSVNSRQRHLAGDPSIGIPNSGRTKGASSRCSRLGCVMLSLACFLFGDPALAQKPAPQKVAGTLTIDPTQTQKPWTGDLDGMIERRVIRVLIVNSKTFYFVDKGDCAAPSLTHSGCLKTNSTRSSPPKIDLRTRTVVDQKHQIVVAALLSRHR